MFEDRIKYKREKKSAKFYNCALTIEGISSQTSASNQNQEQMEVFHTLSKDHPNKPRLLFGFPKRD